MNKSRYQLPLYCHNLVEMQLNRLPMTLKLPVSSKDDSNIDGSSSVLSSEDDCNTIEFALESWTWYHKGEHVAELLYP